MVLTALILLTACFTLFGYLTSRQYIPYSDNIASVTTYGECASGVQAGADCRELLLITFDKKVTGYEVTEAIGEEPNDGHYYYIGAWTTKLDEIIGKQGVQNVVIERKDEKPITILYQQNNDTFDVILYNDDFSSESGMAMPRLALGYYVVISLALIAVLTVLIIIFRKKTKVRRVLTKILFAPVAYIIGHVCAMGFSTLSYSMPFDFYRIMLTALPIYFILILISSLCERKKRQA